MERLQEAPHRSRARDPTRWGRLVSSLGRAGPWWAPPSAASRMFLHRLLGLYLRRSLSWFDSRAHVAPFGLYKQTSAPISGAIPETLNHILLMRIRASYQEKISTP
jgi:hypothetical protein